MVWQFREKTHPKLRGQSEQRQRDGCVGVARTQGMGGGPGGEARGPDRALRAGSQSNREIEKSLEFSVMWELFFKIS